MPANLNEKLSSEFTQAEFLDVKGKPLDVFPPFVRPYLELIRLEKVSRCYISKQSEANSTISSPLGLSLCFGLSVCYFV